MPPRNGTRMRGKKGNNSKKNRKKAAKGNRGNAHHPQQQKATSIFFQKYDEVIQTVEDAKGALRLHRKELGSAPEAVMLRLCDALAANTTITGLDLHSNKLGSAPEAVMAPLGVMLEANTTIKTLSLNGNELGSAPEAVMARLGNALAANTTITTLGLNLNDLGSAPEAVIARLCVALAANTTITALYLTGNKLGSSPEAVMARLGDVLAKNTTITSLYLGSNKLGSAPEAVMARLCDALAKNTTITTLGLGYNDLGSAPEPVMARLCDALAANTAITKLDLDYNDLGSASEAIMARLADGLGRNSHLISLKLGDSGSWSDENRALLSHALASHPSITSVEGVDGGVALPGAVAATRRQAQLQRLFLPPQTRTFPVVLAKVERALSAGLFETALALARASDHDVMASKPFLEFDRAQKAFDATHNALLSLWQEGEPARGSVSDQLASLVDTRDAAHETLTRATQALVDRDELKDHFDRRPYEQLVQALDQLCDQLSELLPLSGGDANADSDDNEVGVSAELDGVIFVDAALSGTSPLQLIVRQWQAAEAVRVEACSEVKRLLRQQSDAWGPAPTTGAPAEDVAVGFDVLVPRLEAAHAGALALERLLTHPAFRKLLADARASLLRLGHWAQSRLEQLDAVHKFVEVKRAALLRMNFFAARKAESREAHDAMLQAGEEFEDSEFKLKVAELTARRPRSRSRKQRGGDAGQDDSGLPRLRESVREARGKLEAALSQVLQFSSEFPEVLSLSEATEYDEEDSEDDFAERIRRWLFDATESGSGVVVRRLEDFVPSASLLADGTDTRHRVFQGTDPATGKAVALKEYVAVNEEKARRTMLREFRMLRALKHVRIVEATALFFDSSGKTPCAYLQMPLMSGGTLDQWLVSAQPHADDVQRVLRHAFEAVDHLHRFGVVHSDIKGSQILLDSPHCNASAVLADFDVSNDTAGRCSASAERTRTVTLRVTAGFAAPELYEPGAKCSPASDMYAMGITLKEALLPVIGDVAAVAGAGVDGDDNWEGANEDSVQRHAHELYCSLTDDEPLRRLRAAQALRHDYFASSSVREELLRERRPLQPPSYWSYSPGRVAGTESDSDGDVDVSGDSAGPSSAVASLFGTRHDDSRRMVDWMQLMFDASAVWSDPSYPNQSTAPGHHQRLGSAPGPGAAHRIIRHGRDGSEEHGGFEVLSVERIEHPDRWRRFATVRATFAKHVRATPGASGILDREAVMENWQDWMSDELHLDRDANELLFFHGCPAHTVPLVVEGGLDGRVGGGAGHVLGQGLYLASNVSKADEYITEDADGVCTVFVVRAALGVPFVPENGARERVQVAQGGVKMRMNEIRRAPLMPDGKTLSDSVWHQSGRQSGRDDVFPWKHSEFVVFDHHAAYPEFLVRYKRKPLPS